MLSCRSKAKGTTAKLRNLVLNLLRQLRMQLLKPLSHQILAPTASISSHSTLLKVCVQKRSIQMGFFQMGLFQMVTLQMLASHWEIQVRTTPIKMLPTKTPQDRLVQTGHLSSRQGIPKSGNLFPQGIPSCGVSLQGKDQWKGNQPASRFPLSSSTLFSIISTTQCLPR